MSHVVLYSLAVLTPQQLILAADRPTEAFPDNVTAVIRLATPRKTIQKIVNLATQIDPQFAPVVQLGSAGLGAAVSNPAQAGIDPDGDWWIAVFAHPDREPSLVFAMPAADAEAMQKAIPGQFTFITYENWLLYTEDEQTATAVKQRLGGKGRAIHDAVDERVKTLFGNADGAVYINLKQLKSTYQAEIDRAREEMNNALQEFENFAPPVEGIDLGAIFQMYGRMGSGLFQALDDSHSCSLALTFNDDSLSIEELFLVNAGSASEKLISKHKPSPLRNLNTLQPDQLVYAGFHGNYSQLTSWAIEFYESMIPDKDQAAKLGQTMRELSQLEFGDYSMSFRLADLKGGAVRSAIVVDVKPVDKMRTLGRKLSALMGQISVGGVQQKYDLQPAAETVDGHAVDVLRVEQQINEQVDPLGIQQQLMDALYGGDMTMRTVYLEDKTVQTIGGGTQALGETLKSLTSSRATANAPLLATRAQLLKQANILVLMDTPGIAVDVMKLVVESGQLPIPLNRESLDALNLKRSYSGFSVASVKQGIRVKTTIPAGQIQGLIKIGTMVQKMMTGQPDF